MALFLLVSTTSWTVEKHYCMGRLMDIAIFQEAEGCGMQLLDAEENIEMNCCSDEVTFVEGLDDLKITFNDLSSDQQLFIAAYTHSYFGLFDVVLEQPVPNKDYPPPILVRDIQVLDQVFII
ncbi:MAG: hypothetical protein COA50_00680 [Flavobacteriaceae bacterium]|nr:MAG: hypothetical protein COA50_00680 [Flavobacteriaceae bacterium]